MVGRLSEIKEVFHGVFHVKTHEYVVKFKKSRFRTPISVIGDSGTQRDSGGI
jgi:hypothetical protein